MPSTFITSDAMRIPIATYRLQLNKDFKLRQALKVIPYLKKLGISDCYCSPILKARTGSTHCYDVTDHQHINPELGSIREFKRWSTILHSSGMGLLLDIVPNHMAISDENLLLLDVLKFGPFSKYADFFDINWNPAYAPNLNNKLILPILGTKISEAVRNRQISLTFSKGQFFLQIYSLKLPVTPKSYAIILDLARRELALESSSQENVLKLSEITQDLSKLPDSSTSRTKGTAYPFSLAIKKEKDLARLCSIHPEIESAINQSLVALHRRLPKGNNDEIRKLFIEQFYKLEFWKDALNKANFRRFVAVNDLIAIREERPLVFYEAHSLILNLAANRDIDGLRIDHIDGLCQPSEYLSRLQRSCQRQLSIPRGDQKPFYAIVEKILGEGEDLPENWCTHGTTGYEFLSDLNGIFIDDRNSLKLDRAYSNFTSSRNMVFERIAESSRRRVIDSSMKSELSYLASLFVDIAKEMPNRNQLFEGDVRAAIRELAVWFPVYRSYSISQVSIADRRAIEQSARSAILRLNRRDVNGRCLKIVHNIRRILLLDFSKHISGDDRMKWRIFASRFQQLTAPVAVKAIEDTAFYVYNKLISLNEVGGNPRNFGISLERFHKNILRRSASHPHSLLATSTHDTKRSEDVRARINVLSEIPEQWTNAALYWRELNKGKKRIVEGESCPSNNDEYMLYQTMIGIWPFQRVDARQREELIERISSYMKKAVREAKVKTSWIDPNFEYEDALDNFIKAILDPRSVTSRKFLLSFYKFHKHTSYYGMLNSLSQLLLKLTCPGVPDIYQGNEIWDFSLVDPDNRRQVDFGLRSKMLSSLEQRSQSSKGEKDSLARDLVSNMSNGLIKMYVLSRVLKFRSRHEVLFKRGDYNPIKVQGPKSQHVCALMRKTNDDECIVVAPRLFVSLLGGAKYQNAKNIWKETYLSLPKDADTSTYSNIFNGAKVQVEQQGNRPILQLSAVLDGFPVALLAPKRPANSVST